MTQRGGSLFGRVTNITKHYFQGATTTRPTLLAAAVATNSVFGVLNWMNGRQFDLLSPDDKTVWRTTALQSFSDDNGRIQVENVRNASQEQIQQRIDAIADSQVIGARYRVVRPIEDGDPHEYLGESTGRISASAMASLKQELLMRPDNVHRLMMAAVAMGAVPLDGERANQIASVQQDAITALSFPKNQLTDSDVQRAKDNFANGSKLEPNMQLGPFNLITAERPQVWSKGDRFYFSFNAITLKGIHIFSGRGGADGVAQHTGCLDVGAGLLHTSVVGAGTSQTCLAALANVTSAASMWSNRSEVVARICETANGQALNTFDLQKLVTQATDGMDSSRSLERWALRTLDKFSGDVVMLTDAAANCTFALPDAAKPATMDVIKTSYANQEPYLPDDMLTPLKAETDLLVQAELARPISVRDNPSDTNVVGDGGPLQQDHANDANNANDANAVQDDPLSDPIEPRPDPNEIDATAKETPPMEDSAARVTTPDDAATQPDALGRTNVDGAGPIDPGIPGTPGTLDPAHPGGIATPDPGIPNPIDPARTPIPGLDIPGGPTPIETGPTIPIPHVEPGRGPVE